MYTINLGSDIRLGLKTSQQEALRPISGAWNEIWLALHLSFTDAGADLTSPILSFGLCSSTGGYLPRTKHWYGVNFLDTTWPRNTVRYTAGAAWGFSKRVSGTTSSLSAINSAFGFSLTPTTVLTALVLRFLKGSPNWTLGAAYPSAATPVNLTETSLRTAMRSASFASLVSSLGYSSSTHSPAAPDEVTHGNLDRFCFSWSSPTANLLVSNAFFRIVS